MKNSVIMEVITESFLERLQLFQRTVLLIQLNLAADLCFISNIVDLMSEKLF